MDDETLEAAVAQTVLRDGARSVRGDTLLLVDPTEIRKEFSYKMEFVARVRDASRSSKDGRKNPEEYGTIAAMEVKIEESWKNVLSGEFEEPYFAELAAFVKSEYSHGAVYPPGRFIFEAFNRTPFGKVKAVILGQDPYHGPNQAHGLCFSVRGGVPVPPSLANIYKELENEYGKPFLDRDGDLSGWADQGVLLLNATLTVAAGRAGSHQGRGWERFTDAAISRLAASREHVVFMLWGGYAQRKGAFIDRRRHLVLETSHPSPLSAYRGFFGCGHFKKANEYLAAHGIAPVDW